MAKKKKHKKRAKVSQGQGKQIIQQSSTVVAATSDQLVPTEQQPSGATAVDMVRWGYVRGDMRRIGVISAICIGIELILWYTLSSTAVGSAVYQLIQL